MISRDNIKYLKLKCKYLFKKIANRFLGQDYEYWLLRSGEDIILLEMDSFVVMSLIREYRKRGIGIGSRTVYNLMLYRLNGTKTVNANLLTRIASTLGTYISQHKNAIIYFDCDTISVPITSNRHLLLSPVEYRDKLFRILCKRLAYYIKDSDRYIHYSIITNDEEGLRYKQMICNKLSERYIEVIADDLTNHGASVTKEVFNG